LYFYVIFFIQKDGTKKAFESMLKSMLFFGWYLKFVILTKKLSANHLGYFEFRLCPFSNANQDCLNRNLLQITTSGSTQFKVQGGVNNFNIK
jgi:hypothetical protein